MRAEIVGSTVPTTMAGALVVIDAVTAERDRLAAELAQARAETDGAKAELDNVMYQFKNLGANIAGLTGLMNDYHTERDDAQESRNQYARRLDSMCDERDEALTRVQELEAEVAELRGES
ncbi:hypothetical protein H7K45_27955 [Mycobacterium yunnanensis]|uniref:Uncharacterized protein n=1 Tax=Mycobacterium yunnanensis TaxID=368477 RepID=A0A9X3C4E9_9MYCO|nr:hypothetical protein [Mycobacterium yunnanensis]MCV7424386.1 hypothetical protein [Mycobacterium yunnanensis]